MRFIVILVAASVVFWSTGDAALGSTLFSSQGRLYQIDQATGAPTAVSDALSTSDLASTGLAGEMTIWSVGFGNGGNSQLVEINPFSGMILSTTALPAVIRGLAIDPTDGQFYGTSVSQLFHIDPVTGALELVGNLGTTTVPFRLAFDKTGQLFGIHENDFYSIDKTNAALTTIGTLPIFHSGALAFRPEDGTLFGIGYTGRYQLFTINTTDASVTIIGDSLSRPSGLVFLAVPEPAALALSLLVVLMTWPRGLRLIASP